MVETAVLALVALGAADEDVETGEDEVFWLDALWLGALVWLWMAELTAGTDALTLDALLLPPELHAVIDSAMTPDAAK